MENVLNRLLSSLQSKAKNMSVRATKHNELREVHHKLTSIKPAISDQRFVLCSRSPHKTLVAKITPSFLRVSQDGFRQNSGI